MKKEVLEVWKAVPGFPNYIVSNLGRLRVNGKLKVLKGRGFSYPNRQKGTPVAKLILLSFRGEAPVGKPLALHRDDNIENNALSNLYWGSPRENNLDAYRNGKLVSYFKGKRLSPEHRQKIGASNKGVTRNYPRKQKQ